MGCEQSVEAWPAEVVPEDPFEKLLFEIRQQRSTLDATLSATTKSSAHMRFLLTTVTKSKSVLNELSDMFENEASLGADLVYHIAHQDADDLHEATTGIGADETKMGQVLVTRLPEMLAITDTIYQKKHGIDLETLVNKEGKSNLGWLLTGGLSDFGKFMSFRVMSQGRRDALLLRSTMAGIGCNDPVLLEVLTTRTNEDLKSAFEAYRSEFPGEDLIERIKSETGGMMKKNYGNWVDMLCEFDRDESMDAPSHSEVESKCQELYDAGYGKTFGCDEDVFLNILNKANNNTIAAIKKCYKKMFDDSLVNHVKKKMGGDLEYAVVARLTKRLRFFARRIYDACKGWGTDEGALVRLLGCINNEEVMQLREVWTDMYQNEEAPYDTMRSLLLSELGGDFATAVTQMLDTESPKGHWKSAQLYIEDAYEGATEFQEKVINEFTVNDAVVQGTQELHGPLAYSNVTHKETFMCANIDDEYPPSSPVIVVEIDRTALFDTEPADMDEGQALLMALKDQTNKLKAQDSQNNMLIEVLKPAYDDNSYQVRKMDILTDQITRDNLAMLEFCAQRDATAVHEAVDGWGADKDKLINVLCSLTKKQLMRVSEIYTERHGKTLREMIDGELVGFFGSSSHFKYFMQLLLTHPAEADAELLADSMEGFGTDESLLTEICCTRSNLEILAAKRAFMNSKGKSVENWVSQETSSMYMRFLFRCLQGDRKECFSDAALAAEQAGELNAAGLGGGDKNERVLFDILATSSSEHCELIKKAYHEQFGTTLMQAIKDAMGGDVEDAMLARVENKYKYYAGVLNKAWKGFGTDEKATSRLFARMTKSDIKKIGLEYEKLTSTKFEDAIKSEVGGMYKQALLVYLFKEAPGASDEPTPEE